MLPAPSPIRVCVQTGGVGVGRVLGAARARMRYDGADWIKVIGSDATSATFNLGVTHALSARATVVTMLGIGLTPDAPDFSLTFKVPYSI